jgi:hypothetical protein
MKVDKDPFPVNMNIVKLDGKKVLVWLSRAELTKGMDVVIGEERLPRMIKPKSPKGGQWQKNEGGGASYGNAQRPPSTFSWPNTRKVGPTLGVVKTGPFGIRQSSFPVSGQHIYSQELIRQMISDSATVMFRRSGTSSARLPSGALLPGRATNAWAVGTSTDDVPALSTFGGVVRTMGSTADALPPGMVRNC